MDGAIVQNNMTKLNGWRKAGKNCDVTLIIGEHEFHAHKNILAVAIEFFEKIFTGNFSEKGKNVITLKDVDPDGFRLILDYIYTGKIKIDDDNFAQVLSLAAYYQIECLIKKLFHYVKSNVGINNGFYYYHSADSVDIRRIIEFTKEFIRNDFLSCSNSAAFLDITHSSLLEFIDSPVKEELDRFKIVMNWIQFDPNKRSNYLSDLLKHVRFSYVSTDAIFHDILDNQLVINNPDIIKAIKERRKMEQTVRIYSMKGSDLIRVDIFNAKLEATNVIVETDVNYEEFQICSSVDAIYVSTFRCGTGNKFYHLKDSQWTFLDDSDYNPKVAHRSIVYSEEYKTIYANNDTHIYSYNLESKSYVVNLNDNDRVRLGIRKICGSLICYDGLVYTPADCTDGYYRILQYDSRVKEFQLKNQISPYRSNAVCAVLGEKMFILSDSKVQMYNIKLNTYTVILQNEKIGISHYSLMGYQNQLYAVRKEWDVIDIFDVSKGKWTEEIHLR